MQSYSKQVLRLLLVFVVIIASCDHMIVIWALDMIVIVSYGHVIATCNHHCREAKSMRKPTEDHRWWSYNVMALLHRICLIKATVTVTIAIVHWSDDVTLCFMTTSLRNDITLIKWVLPVIQIGFWPINDRCIPFYGSSIRLFVNQSFPAFMGGLDDFQSKCLFKTTSRGEETEENIG